MNKENSGMIYTAIICLGLIALILWIFLNAVFGNEVPQKGNIGDPLFGRNRWLGILSGRR